MRNTSDGKRTRKRPFLLPASSVASSIRFPPRIRYHSRTRSIVRRPVLRFSFIFVFPLPIDLLGALLDRPGTPRER
ncbi:hypothetical protein IMT09_21525 [Burkholderia cepacia]|uniref:hypothetical protein n=1 Tax=Burkholderia cepacia TaxID=292 RepID=UPI0012D96BF3|nr:hypothetical protein [Burkholderia cepacia]MBE2970670.1 hypothetical protein [Burkholderia cepacia]